jgi:hypothetical protein
MVKVMQMAEDTEGTEKTEVKISTIFQLGKCLSFSTYKLISVFFSSLFKPIFSSLFGKEARKYTISVLCHYFRHFRLSQWGV